MSHIALAYRSSICRLARARPELSGTYHAVAAGETSWHGYAKHVLEFARTRGEALRVAQDRVTPIASSAYPQAAPRPRNSRLDTTKLRTAFDVVLPAWQHDCYTVTSTDTEVAQLTNNFVRSGPERAICQRCAFGR